MVMPFVLLLIAWAAFHAVYLTSIDPHNISATPPRWQASAKTLLVLAPAILMLAAVDPRSQVFQFASMLAVSLLISPAISTPVRYRANEIEAPMERRIEDIKMTISGSLILKLVSLGLGAATSWLVGSWWVLFLVIPTIVVVSINGLTILLVVQSEHGEFAHLTQTERLAKFEELGPIVHRGVIGFVLSGGAYAYAIVHVAQLTPQNWASYSGLFLGALVSMIEPRT